MKEVIVRTEVLMEMFEQMDSECARLKADGKYEELYGVFQGTKNSLKE